MPRKRRRAEARKSCSSLKKTRLRRDGISIELSFGEKSMIPFKLKIDRKEWRNWTSPALRTERSVAFCATPDWYYFFLFFFLYEVLTTENVKNVHFCNRPVVRFALNGPLRSVLLRIYALLTTKNVKCSFLCLGCRILSHDAVRYGAIIVGIRRRESIC